MNFLTIEKINQLRDELCNSVEVKMRVGALLDVPVTAHDIFLSGQVVGAIKMAEKIVEVMCSEEATNNELA